MNRFFIIAIAFFSYQMIVSQSLTYEYNKKFIYTLGNNASAHAVFFNSTKKVPPITKAFKNSESPDDDLVVAFPYSINKKKYEFQGRALNKKYLLAINFNKNIKNLQRYNFFKTKDTYLINKMDCKEYKAKIGTTNSYIRVFTSNLNDNIDYNTLKKEVENLADLYLPDFENGEIIVEIAMFTAPEKYDPFLKFQKKENINQEFVINKQQIEYVIGEKQRIGLSATIPKYCLFDEIKPSDEEVGFKINSFLQNICDYYETYAFSNLQEYATFFKQEIIKYTNKFSQFKILNKKQINEFESILNEYSKLNVTTELLNLQK